MEEPPTIITTCSDSPSTSEPASTPTTGGEGGSPSSTPVDNKVQTHRLMKAKFNKAVVCKICNKFIRGIGNNAGYMCSICSIPIHKSCAPKAKKCPCREALLALQFAPFVPVVRENCLLNFQRLLYQAEQYDCELPKKLKPLVDDIVKATTNEFTEELANKIHQVWTTKNVRSMYDEFWQKWQITENADYFFDHCLRIASEGYLPNPQDVLRAKPTTPEKSRNFKDRVFKVWLPKGAKLEFTYNPDETLGGMLAQVRQQKDIPEEPSYVAWDANGIMLVGLDKIPLAQLETLEIYYYPEGIKPLQNLTVVNKKTRRLSGNSAAAQKERLSRGFLVPRSHSASKNPSAKQEKRNGMVVVTVDDAANLANNSESLEYVYVVITDGNADKRYRTFPVPNSITNKLLWNQTFKFNVSTSYFEIVLKVWATCSNKTIPDIMLGQVVMCLDGFNDGDNKVEELKLRKEPKKYKQNKKQPAILKVSWQYNDKKLKAEKKSEPPQEGTIGEEGGGGEGGGEGGGGGTSTAEAPKKILEDVYEVSNKLGEGAFSVVKAGTHKENGTKVAIKILDNYSNIENAEEDVLRFQQETSIIKSLDHRHIVKMYDIFEDHEHYYVVMELVSGGELFDQIVEKGAYPEDEAAEIIHQILSALLYLEERKICHRDLKPENLIFTDDTHKMLKLIDFGEAKSCAEGPIREYVGTTDYMAPEIIKGGEYDTRVDMWSLGVITYVMLCGFPPWEGETESDVFVNIMTLQYSFPSPEWDEVSEEARDFVRRLLAELSDRMTARQARQHPWMVSHAPQSNIKMALSIQDEAYSEEFIQRLKEEIVRTLKVNVGEMDVQKEKGTTTVCVTFEE